MSTKPKPAEAHVCPATEMTHHYVCWPCGQQYDTHDEEMVRVLLCPDCDGECVPVAHPPADQVVKCECCDRPMKYTDASIQCIDCLEDWDCPEVPAIAGRVTTQDRILDALVSRSGFARDQECILDFLHEALPKLHHSLVENGFVYLDDIGDWSPPDDNWVTPSGHQRILDLQPAVRS